jgi:hypothetical protein
VKEDGLADHRAVQASDDSAHAGANGDVRVRSALAIVLHLEELPRDRAAIHQLESRVFY